MSTPSATAKPFRCDTSRTGSRLSNGLGPKPQTQPDPLRRRVRDRSLPAARRECMAFSQPRLSSAATKQTLFTRLKFSAIIEVGTRSYDVVVPRLGCNGGRRPAYRVCSRIQGGRTKIPFGERYAHYGARTANCPIGKG